MKCSGAETWKYNKNLDSKLMSMKMDFLRRSARSWELEEEEEEEEEKIPKKNIKNLVLDYIRYKQLNWYSHAWKMTEEKLPWKHFGTVSA